MKKNWPNFWTDSGHFTRCVSKIKCLHFFLKKYLKSLLKHKFARLTTVITCFHNNGMLRHSFLRVGEDIPLQHILLPQCSFYSPSSYWVALTTCLLALACEGGYKGSKCNSIRRRRVKAALWEHIMLQRNIFRQPIENEWLYFFKNCGPYFIRGPNETWGWQMNFDHNFLV